MIFQIALVSLCASSLFDALFSGTFLVGWKQLIVVGCWLTCFRYHASVRVYQSLVLVGLLNIVLLASSLVEGVSLGTAAFNAFFYSSWIPFFILSHRSEWSSRSRLKIGWMILFLTSTIGLYIDLHTDLFAFLRTEIIDRDYLDKHEIARRASFLFNTSTTVLPMVGGIGLMAFLQRPSAGRAAIITVGLAICAVATGSLSGFGVALLCAIGILGTISGSVLRLAVVLSCFIGVVFGIGLASQNTETIGLQVDRVLDNTDVQSDANVGRSFLWRQAIATIEDMSPAEHILGRGLGTTNSRFDSTALYTHGESSLLQAYIEAGILGLAFRCLPFVMAGYFFMRVRGKHKFAFAGYFSGTAIAISLAPTFGFIPLEAMLGYLLGGLALQVDGGEVAVSRVSMAAAPGRATVPT